jgi:hypothetical protein
MNRIALRFAPQLSSLEIDACDLFFCTLNQLLQQLLNLLPSLSDLFKNEHLCLKHEQYSSQKTENH